MSEEIKTIKLPTSCITSNNTPCPTNIEVAPLESSEKNTITSSLFYMLGSMDTIVTEAAKYIEKGLPFYVKIGLEVKNASKTMTLNISNEALDTEDILILGGLQIGISVGIEAVMSALVTAGIISGGWALVLGIGAAVLVAYFLSDLYLYLKDKSLSLWQDFKKTSNQAIQNIMSLIETDERSLQERKKEITERAANRILDSTNQSKMTQKEYEECITYLCGHCCENKTNDTFPLFSPNTLSSQESFLPPDTINSHRVGEIHFSIQILDEYTRIPIENAKLQLQNVNLGQESITNTQGLATFMIKESEYLKPFMAKLIHNNYQECPIFDRSIIPNAYRSAKKPLELRFLGKIHCYFNGKELILRNVTKTDIF